MIAIDTNVIVRIVANDDPVQEGIARALVNGNPVFVSLIALVEAAWVLSARDSRGKAWVAADLKAFVALDTVELELRDWALWALDRYQEGHDLADMILLVTARDQASFATFDRKLARREVSGSPVAVRELT